VCSSSDEGHDVLLRLYHTRFSEQAETADAMMSTSLLDRPFIGWRNEYPRALFSIGVCVDML
jgi:hypothetical protein